MGAKTRFITVLAVILAICSFSVLYGERFFPDKADKYSLTLKGKKVYFYRYKATDYLYVSTKGFETADLQYFKRNPNLCFSGKISNVADDLIEFFGTTQKAYFDANLSETVNRLKKGDNIWIFGMVKVYKNDDFEININYVFELQSDEELFLRWKKETDKDDPDAQISLGMKALKYGKEHGNSDVWEKMGRKSILKGLELKKEKITEPKQYLNLADEVLNLLGDKEFAAAIVVEAWKKNKGDSNLNHYLKNILKFSMYKDEWYPVNKRFEKEFWDRFNAIKYTDDNAMWELKNWIDRNANKITDPEEKAILCAQRAYEMNPARKDAAAFLGKEPILIEGLTSGDEIIVPRQPIIVPVGKAKLEFSINSFWLSASELPEGVLQKYTVGGKTGASALVRSIEWGANIEEMKDKFIDSIKDFIDNESVETEIITVNGKEYYRIVYQQSIETVIVKNEAILVDAGEDTPGIALILSASKNTWSKYSDEIRTIRASLKFTK